MEKPWSIISLSHRLTMPIANMVSTGPGKVWTVVWQVVLPELEGAAWQVLLGQAWLELATVWPA